MSRVGSSWSGLPQAGVGWWGDGDVVAGADGEDPVGAQDELEPFGVDEGVVAVAEQDEVVEVGAAAVGPVDDVVSVELRVARAAGEAAALAVEGAEGAA